MCVLIKKIVIVVYFDKICVIFCKLCLVCNKIKFIINIINVTGIHTFYFYNNRYKFITTDITCTTKHTYFIKININPLAGPKCDHNQ